MFLATLIRSTFGFGEALIAVPLLSLILPVEVAAPIAVLASIIVAGTILFRDWRHIQFKSVSWLLISTLFGIPIGLLILKSMPESMIKGLLGGLILSYSAYSLWSRKVLALSDDRYAWLFGLLAGVSGGTYGINGPPLAVYGAMRGWSPAKFRATLQGYFFPASIVGMLGFGVTGLWTHAMIRLSLGSLPAIIIGIPVGQYIHERLETRSFARILNIGLGIIGLVLLLQAILRFRA